jgi:hypothetical protein
MHLNNSTVLFEIDIDQIDRSNVDMKMIVHPKQNRNPTDYHNEFERKCGYHVVLLENEVDLYS